MRSDLAIMLQKQPEIFVVRKVKTQVITVHLFCKKLDNQARSGRLKSVDSVANMVSSTLRVSGELSISKSSVVSHFHDLGKTIENFMLPECCKTSDSP